MTVHSFILGHLGMDATAASSVTSVAQQLIQCLTQGLSSGAGMPELPEVETVRLVLEPQIKGRKITDIIVVRPEIIAHPHAEEFRSYLIGQTIDRLGRRGKFLIIHFISGDKIIVHLRMTGCLLLMPADYPKEKHTHLILQDDNGCELRFSDTRRFGRFWLLRKGESDTYSGMDKLGLEPFDGSLTANYLQQHFGKRKKAVKECLLEQSVVAGIGNIYSDEILLASGIHPARPAKGLTYVEWERLAAVIPERLAYFHRKERAYPGGISGQQGAGLPQYAIPPGLWPRWGALPELQSHTLPHDCWRQEQRVLSKVPDVW